MHDDYAQRLEQITERWKNGGWMLAGASIPPDEETVEVSLFVHNYGPVIAWREEDSWMFPDVECSDDDKPEGEEPIFWSRDYWRPLRDQSRIVP